MQQVGSGDAQSRVRQVGERTGHLFQRPGTADIGERGGERHVALGPAHRRGGLGARQGRLERGEIAKRRVAHDIGAAAQDRLGYRRLPQREFCQIGAVAADRGEQSFGGRRQVRRPRVQIREETCGSRRIGGQRHGGLMGHRSSRAPHRAAVKPGCCS